MSAFFFGDPRSVYFWGIEANNETYVRVSTVERMNFLSEKNPTFFVCDYRKT